MTKRTWVYPKGGEPFEVGGDWTPTTGGPPRTSEGELFGKLQATDGTDLSTRKRWREYQKQHGLTGTSDYTETWAKAEKKRDDHYTNGEQYRRKRTEDVARALYQHRDRKR